MRLGFTCLEDQDLELPLGAHPRSYAYSSTGKVVTGSKYSATKVAAPFEAGDVLGALIQLKPPKPVFLQKKPR